MTEIKRYKVSDHFMLDEFIDPVTYNQLGHKSGDFIDGRLIDIAEFIRVQSMAPVVINNYLYAKGNIHIYRESGLRRPETKTGAKLSAHKFFIDENGILKARGRAIDVKMQGKTGKEMFDWCAGFKKELYDLGVRRIEHYELTPTWLHLDCKDHGTKDAILIIGLTEIRDTWQIAG